MKFELDPPSGYAGSYLDVKFTVSFDKTERAEICLFNKTSNQQINILSATCRIINGTNLIAEKTDRVSGYINIFNHDKMNSKMEKIPLIEISCNLKMINGELETMEEKTTEFYNESMSLDYEVPPFTLLIQNKEIDLDAGDPLKMKIVSDKEQKYEIAIKPNNGSSMYVFEILSKNGELCFEIPSEILSHHLNFNRTRQFVFYSIRYEGMTSTGHMNRKFIQIPELRVCFKGDLKLKPQKRTGPDGSDLSDDFVLSDRYFVHTMKEFTSLNQPVENIQSMSNMPRLLHEAFALQQLEKQPMIENQNILKKESYKEQNKYVKIKNKSFGEVSASTSSLSLNQKKTVAAQVKKSGGCGCSRKQKT